MLIADNICKSYPTASGELSVLRGVSLTLHPGESAAVMGPSGCGKSTLLNILGTLEPATSGALMISDRNVYSLPESELAQFRNQTIGFVFQEHHLLPQCSVLENVLTPTLVQSGANALDQARSLLDRVGLSGRLDHRPAELSGGERQRVAIARALINRPSVVLADEPTGNLDRATSQMIGELLSEMHREASAVLFVVTHSVELARRFDRVYSLSDGLMTRVES